MQKYINLALYVIGGILYLYAYYQNSMTILQKELLHMGCDYNNVPLVTNSHAPSLQEWSIPLTIAQLISVQFTSLQQLGSLNASTSVPISSSLFFGLLQKLLAFVALFLIDGAGRYCTGLFIWVIYIVFISQCINCIREFVGISLPFIYLAPSFLKH